MVIDETVSLGGKVIGLHDDKLYEHNGIQWVKLVQVEPQTIHPSGAIAVEKLAQTTFDQPQSTVNSRPVKGLLVICCLII